MQNLQNYPPQNFPSAASLQQPHPYYHGNYAQYGNMYFTPSMMKANEPARMPSSKHPAIIVVSILLLAAIIVCAVGFNSFLTALAFGLILGLTYLLYIIIAICCSETKGYITNLNKFDEYKQIYDSMVQGKGYFIFWIECYHYETRTDHEGRTSTHKVVTYTNQQKFQPRISEDDSGNIAGIKDIKKYVFIHYEKKFYFSDEKSAHIFDQAYQSFIARNSRDVHQNFSQVFDIYNFQEEVGFCAMGEGSHNCCVFYLATFFGMALLYSCVVERAASRYQINIVKRLTC